MPARDAKRAPHSDQDKDKMKVEIRNKIYKEATINFWCGVSVFFQDWKARVDPDVWEKIRQHESGWVFAYDNYREGDKVRIFRDIGLGDILFTTPGIREIKKTGAKVYYTTAPRYSPLLKKNPYLDGLNDSEPCNITIDLRRVGMDRDFTNNRSEEALREMFLNPEGKDKSLVLEMSDESRNFADSVNRLHKGASVLVEYEASTGHRTYPYVLDVARKLANDYTVFITTPYRSLNIKEKGIVDLSGKLNLDQLIGLVSTVSAIICNDSGTQYLGEVFKKPTLAIYGDIDPDLRVRYFKNIRTIFAKNEGIECSPCNEKFRCARIPDCLYRIGPERVVNEFNKINAN